MLRSAAPDAAHRFQYRYDAFDDPLADPSVDFFGGGAWCYDDIRFCSPAATVGQSAADYRSVSGGSDGDKSTRSDCDGTSYCENKKVS